jgi:hypothetical protein
MRYVVVLTAAFLMLGCQKHIHEASAAPRGPAIAREGQRVTQVETPAPQRPARA